MMNDETFTCSLAFNDFSLDFDIKQKESIELTSRFPSHGSDFVFAVSETWLRTQDSSYLIIPAVRPGNLVEEFKEFSNELSNPISVPELENIISRGGWSTWIRRYWDRVNNDCSEVDDEKIYGMLIKLSAMESRAGSVVVYRYDGKPTIEIAAYFEEKIEPISFWSEFDPENTAREVRALQRSIKAKLLELMR